MFIGPELSTHTISFKVSPQHECDALRQKDSINSPVIYMKTFFTLHKCFTLTRQLFPAPNRNPGETGGQKTDPSSLSEIIQKRQNNNLGQKRAHPGVIIQHISFVIFPGFSTISIKICFFVIWMNWLWTNSPGTVTRVSLWSPPLVHYLIYSSPHRCIAPSQPSRHVHHT